MSIPTVTHTYGAGVRTYNVKCSECGHVRGVYLTLRDVKMAVTAHKRKHKEGVL